MPQRLRLNFPPEKKLAARRAYDKGAPQVEVAAILGCSQGTARRRVIEWGWEPERSPRPYRRRPKFRFVPDGAEDRRRDNDEISPYGQGPERFEIARPEIGQPETDDLARQMKQLVAREMHRVRTCGGPATDVARTLASLAQTLKTLCTLPDEEDEAQAGSEDLGFDPDEYRAAIVRRLDEMAAEREEFASRIASTDGGGI